jgi:deuterolysin
MDIDGDEAAKVPYLVKLLDQKRTVLSCSGEREAVMKQALENCVMLASNASDAAKSGLLMQEYFKSSSGSVISEVSARFDAVAQECSSTISGESSVLVSTHNPLSFDTSPMLTCMLLSVPTQPPVSVPETDT